MEFNEFDLDEFDPELYEIRVRKLYGEGSETFFNAEVTQVPGIDTIGETPNEACEKAYSVLRKLHELSLQNIGYTLPLEDGPQ